MWFTSKLQGRKILTCCKFLQLNLTSISYSFWNITQKVLKLKKKVNRRAEPPDTFLEENHPMTISSKFCSYWANGFRQEDFYGKFGCGGHLGLCSEMPDTILEEDHPRIISAKLGWDWLSSFRGENFFFNFIHPFF